jgi:hypothetical protein
VDCGTFANPPGIAIEAKVDYQGKWASNRLEELGWH